MGILLIAGDTGSKIIITCKDRDTGAAIDLTGATVKLRYSISGGTTVEKTATVVSPPTLGQVSYQFLANDLVSGTMYTEVKITDISGFVITSLEPITISVGARL